MHKPSVFAVLFIAASSASCAQVGGSGGTSKIAPAADASGVSREVAQPVTPRAVTPTQFEPAPPSAAPIATVSTPSLTVDEAGNRRAMIIDTIDSHVVIQGLLAETRVTMTFRNPNDRVLEGELVFPLPEEASVSGFGLDVGGQLVEGVVVEKQAARVAFEKEVRKGIDPGLVEWVKGNSFRTRVYPIPAHGTRTVMVRYAHPLIGDAQQAVYQLPLAFEQPIPEFKLKVEVVRGEVQPTVSGGLANFSFNRWQDRWVAETAAKNAVLREDLRVALPALPAQWVSVEADGDQHVFVVHDAVSERPKASGRLDPKRILLYWDASLSRLDALDKELKFLESLLGRWPGMTVDVVVFRDRAEAAKRFELVDGNSAALSAYLRAIDYDGGTDLASLRFPAQAEDGAYDLHLLFSDGMGNVGPRPAIEPSRPLFTVASDASANHPLLRHLARGSGGAHVNLAALSEDQALARLRPEPYAFLGAEYPAGSIADLYPSQRQPVSGRTHVSGRLLVDEVTITLLYGRGDAVYKKVPVTLRRAGATTTGLVARHWAQAVVAELAVAPKPDRERMLQLGRRYGIVTPGTSLLVLETLAQHIEHDVRPPDSRPELLKGWLAHQTSEKTKRSDGREQKLATLRKLWAKRVAWWKKVFEPSPVTGEEKEKRGIFQMIGGGSGGFGQGRADNAREAVAEEGAPPPARRMMAKSSAARGGGGRPPAAPAPSQVPAKAKKEAAEPAVAADIAVRPWDPKTPYMVALKAAARSGKAYSVYIAQRPGYMSSPAYFLDCANYFYRAGDAVLGRRILSSILEMKIDDPALLRVVAYRLGETADLDLAVKLLDTVLELRPEEPQSVRDLALMLARRAAVDGAEAKAVAADLSRSMELLHQVVMGKWDRFAEIELIALMELNRLLVRVDALPAKTQAMVRRPDLDKALITPLDLDVRISLSWDADATDIDLWVFEPSGEKAYYSNNLTQIGGLVSRDFTAGYGPEEYVLHRAMPGPYRIVANYYGSQRQTLTGPVTVKAVVMTNWGRKNERRQELTLRLETVRAEVEVGTVTIGAGAEAALQGKP